ncbi:MAG: hypothetical protein LBG96_16100, partial [Tannerella sp.]|nr:hypothetical protein [Tannerella sp.]
MNVSKNIYQAARRTANFFKNRTEADGQARRACPSVNFFKNRTGDTELVPSAGLLRRADVCEAGGRTRRTANFLKTLALLCALLAAALPDALRAQGIDDLGVVWSKTYGTGTIRNIKPNTDGTYTACGYPWVDGVDPKLDRLKGLVVEFDESGSMLWSATVQIPQSYIDNHPDGGIDAAAYAWFEVAFKTDDGGHLAFGRFANRGAPNSEKQPNWNSSSAGSQYLTEGFWIVKFDAAGAVIRNELVRGLWAIDGWRTSDDNFVVGGFDVSYRGINGTSADSITLLRKYDQNGDTIKTNKANYREITSIYKYPTTDGFIAVTPDRFLRIDQNLNITAKSFSSLNFPLVKVPSSGMITPTKENGGAFIPVSLHVLSNDTQGNYQRGYGFYKVDASDQLKYYRTWVPHDTIVSAPLLLPGNSDPAKYIGTATLYNSSGIATAIRMYELTDTVATSSFGFVLGDPYPSGTT